MQCMGMDAGDYTVSQIKGGSDDVVSCYCYLKGDSAIENDADLKTLCSDYTSAKTNAVVYSILLSLSLVILNLIVKHGFYYLKNFYRFASLRTMNIVVVCQIYF